MVFSVYADETVVVGLDGVLSGGTSLPSDFYGIMTKTIYVTVMCVVTGAMVHLLFEAPSVAAMRSFYAKDTSSSTLKMTAKERRRQRLMNNNVTKQCLSSGVLYLSDSVALNRKMT